MDAISFGEHVTRYQGQRLRCAVVLVAGYEIKVGLADTARCAQDIDMARLLLATLAKQHHLKVSMEGQEFGLQEHCRKLTKWKPRKPRY